MYKIIIVDDEDIVRRSIVMKIKWKEIGFDEPYQACNGLEAYELALKVQPDIVFADIKMPIMDGLELANKLKEDLPETHVVIFSGHDEFKYAQESITLGVLDYILKPLGSVTLTKKFKKIKAQLDELSTKRAYLATMKEQLHKSLPLLRESFLNGLVCSPNSNLYSSQRMSSLDLQLGKAPYIVAVIEPVYTSKDFELMDVLLFGIKNIIHETVGSTHPCFTDATGRIIVLFSYEELLGDYLDREILSDTLDVLQKAFLLHLKLETTIGFGHEVNTINELNTSYIEALSALDCKYTIGSGKIYDIQDLTDIKSEFLYPKEFSDQFIAAVKANNKSDIHMTTLALSSHIAKKNNLSLANLKFIYIELVTSLTRLLAESKKSSEILWSRTLDLYKEIEAYKSITSVTTSLEQVATEIANSLSQLSISSRKNIVLEASSYIQNNYTDETISLKSVASHVAVSSGYLSAIFKAENNINFNAYLTRIRMEEGKRLLATTDKNIYDIAYETGHANPHYFSISFKKYTKLSPSDYRLNIRNQ